MRHTLGTAIIYYYFLYINLYDTYLYIVVTIVPTHACTAHFSTTASTASEAHILHPVFSTHPDIKAGDEDFPSVATKKSNNGSSNDDGLGNHSTSMDILIEAIVWIDAFTAVYFTIEYVIRFSCAPRKLVFFIQPLNVVDLLAILPYLFSFVLDHLSEFHIIGKAGKVRFEPI